MVVRLSISGEHDRTGTNNNKTTKTNLPIDVSFGRKGRIREPSKRGVDGVMWVVGARRSNKDGKMVRVR